MKVPQDIVGDIAILKLPFDMKVGEKKKVAEKFLKNHINVNVVLEKTGKFSGRLRKPVTKFLAGEKRKETIHKESDCKFFLDVDDTYFSPRLSNERKVVGDEIVKIAKKSKKIRVLVMFAGVGPFPIVIGKKLKLAGKKGEIISNELNRKASKFAEKNVMLNKLGDFVEVVQGDSKKLKLSGKVKGKFDVIVMPRPNLKDTFLESALKFVKKGSVIYYYGFGDEKKVFEEVKEGIGRRKVGKIKMRKAGEIGFKTFRWLVKFKVG
jgi:tRNA (guanine37-N1)-methyltransferase